MSLINKIRKPLTLPINYSKSHSTTRKKAREQYVVQQEGKCWYCKCPLSGNPSKKIMSACINKKLFPKGMFDYPVHLHHDHNTHMSIGAVHARCNAYLWQYLGE